MAYSDFTLSELKEQFGLVIEQVPDLFAVVQDVLPPAPLTGQMKRNIRLAVSINSEKARSEFLIAPVLAELKFLHDDRISLFSGLEFNVDEAAGLKGRCDFILTQDPFQLEINAPVCVLVEAKNENMVAGIPQCLAEMVAALRFNARSRIERRVYGIVSTGTLWRFLTLEGKHASIDSVEYPIQSLDKIFGILTTIALN